MTPDVMAEERRITRTYLKENKNDVELVDGLPKRRRKRIHKKRTPEVNPDHIVCDGTDIMDEERRVTRAYLKDIKVKEEVEKIPRKRIYRKRIRKAEEVVIDKPLFRPCIFTFDGFGSKSSTVYF